MHPKGIDYAHLLQGMDKVPLIIDSNDDVLSFPPIINGKHTTVSTKTRDIFIDVTGWDLRACESSLMLICLQLAKLGGRVESVRVSGHDDKEWIIDGTPIEHKIERNLLEEILGNQFTDEEIGAAISRMGGIYNGEENGTLYIFMPRWRFDILHPIDLVEEVAIGHGYDDLSYDVPKAPLTAIARGDDKAREKLVTSNLRFVIHIAKSYKNQGLSMADLINEGNMGLMTAARKFKPEKGYKFIPESLKKGKK